MPQAVRLQYSGSSRTFTLTVPVAIVKLKGWLGTYHAPKGLRERKPDLPPDTEGTVLTFLDEPAQPCEGGCGCGGRGAVVLLPDKTTATAEPVKPRVRAPARVKTARRRAA